MDDAVRMRVAERVTHMRSDGERVLRRQAALAADHLRHVRAIDKGHDDVKLALRRLAEVMHRHDGGMIELRHDACLVFEALDIAGIDIIKPRRQNLDGDRPI